VCDVGVYTTHTSRVDRRPFPWVVNDDDDGNNNDDNDDDNDDDEYEFIYLYERYEPAKNYAGIGISIIIIL